MKKHLIPFLAVLLLMSSCATNKKVNYFQDIQKRKDTTTTMVKPDPDIRLRPEDKIYIQVNSRDPELAALFNLNTRDQQTGTSRRELGYTVLKDGTIDFPVLGYIPVAGKTRDELAAYIKTELIDRNLVNDPVVTVDFMNLQFSIMGEVNNPGTYSITHNSFTILDALSAAGDMKISGKRKNILLLRPDSLGQMTAYNIDMRNFASVHNSPAYYIHQNDYIYVEPNRKQANESTVNGNTVQSVSFWMSLITFISSMATTVSIWLAK